MSTAGKFRVLGLMSGTSLDGLDIAYCTFQKKKVWEYTLEVAETRKYPSGWRKKLALAHGLASEDLMALDSAYGEFIGKACVDFIGRHGLDVDFIASHGHTVFHQPAKRFTLQIGNGNAIHAATGLPVVYDFRSLDVVLGGEGAPLVPAGDKFLFRDYDVCLNLGGIANLSTDIRSTRIAFDVCFCNTPLNYLAAKEGKEFDRGGLLASRGEVNGIMLDKLSAIYRTMRKKRPSLGREIFEEKIQSLLEGADISLNDRMRTCVESAAREITSSISELRKTSRVLCTGGGAFNPLLMSRILENAGDDITLIMPEDAVIKFKEALVFAFLGVLRVTGNVNCLKSVTRASRDSSGGVMLGFKAR